MSRPQFPVNANATTASSFNHTPGLIVNHGLIDFQDNFYRGMNSDYAQFMAAQQQQQALSGNFAPMCPTFQSPIPSGLPQSTLLGHPSFINVAGKMYKPVEEPTTAAEPKRLAEAVVEPQPVAITDADVDQRVAQKLNEWMSSQRQKPSLRKRSEEDRAAARVKSVMNAGRPGRFYSPA